MLSLILKETIGKLPTSVFDVVFENKKVGVVQVRHTPSAGISVPQECASHIYYEIDESEQKKGYATEALSLALLEAKKIGLSKVVLTCDKENIPSKKIIERNGGTYTGSCIYDTGRTLLRYEFEI